MVTLAYVPTSILVFILPVVVLFIFSGDYEDAVSFEESYCRFSIGAIELKQKHST